MKLKKLVISAFGPYAQTQELDFEYHLGDRSMFVISGNTGAGKTTIFDAVNFALFGNASGSERDGKSLRSDFASPDTDTWVELDFSLREKEYHIRRSPQYERPKKRGEGTTKTSASAELRLITDSRVVTGYSDVTSEVEKILGINSGQFKQLVMIPQGEFKRLLSADSGEKEMIFRKIFGTEAFSQIQKNIVERSNSLKRTIEDASIYRRSLIRRFRPAQESGEIYELMAQEMPASQPLLRSFREDLEKDTENAKALDARSEDLRKQQEKIQEEIIKGDEINKKLRDLESSRKTYQALALQIEDNELLKARTDLAKKALEIQPLEEKLLDKRHSLQKKSGELALLEENTRKLSEALDIARKAAEDMKARQSEKQQLEKALDRLSHLREKTAGYEQKKAEAKELEARIKETGSKIETAEASIITCAENLARAAVMLEKAAEAKLENTRHEALLTTYREIVKKCRDLINAADEYENRKSEHAKKAAEYDAADEAFKSAQKEYERIEDAYRRNQAGILAAMLEKDKPCPVCGSAHHPSPAVLEHEDISEQALKAARALSEDLRSKRDKIYEKVTQLNTELASLRKNSIDPLAAELFEMTDSKDTGDSQDTGDADSIRHIRDKAENYRSGIIEKGVELKKQYDENLSLTNKEDEIKKARTDAETEGKRLEAEKTELTGLKSELGIKLSAANENISSTEKEFEGRIRTAAELEAEENEMKKQISEIERLTAAADESYAALKGQHDTSGGQILAIKAEIKALEEDIESASDSFEKALRSADFEDLGSYAAALMEKTELSLAEKSLQEFRENLRVAESALEKAEKEAEGLAPADLEQAKEKLEGIKKLQSDADKMAREAYSRIEGNRSVINELEDEAKKLIKLEEEYRTVGDLAKVIKGENSSRMSFERYVLASYYEDIISAANIRFGRMTLGRFELSRKQEVGDARKGSGLDLEVFDNYTGKARDVKTLSGGESFKASLSMALGLADVVQSYAGGIQLDTMFIDEGFGTLDPESLDKAVEALVELQSDGRMVGIISHVPELRERIDARLEVSTTANGSRAEFVVS